MGNSQGTLPSTMRRVVLSKPNADITEASIVVEEVAMPVPRSGEVLIRVLATPVNPSDYGEWTNVLTDGKEFEPRAVGKEGSGIVVASGGGLYANSVVGYKVGFISNVRGQGSYAEYTVVNALAGIFPLPTTVKTEDAASHFVNPYTACGFLDIVKSRHASTGDGKGTPGMVHTAAASQLGQMLVKLCLQENVNLVNVVRREEQAEILRGIGAKHIIVSSVDGWEAKLAALVTELNIHIAFDAVAGEMSGKLLDLLPQKGLLIVYGKLSPEGCSGIQPLDLIYRKKKLEGFYLGAWVQGDMLYQRLRTATALVHGGLGEGGWASSQFLDCSIDNMWTEFIKMWKESGFTGKKLRILFPEVVGEAAK
jgi:NADPH2:quinone reductase